MEKPYTEIVLKEMDDTDDVLYILHWIKGVEFVTEEMDGAICTIRVPGEIKEERFFPGHGGNANDDLDDVYDD